MGLNSILGRSNSLKLALFATGLSGIVAEYVLSTLATYFLGNSVLQWTLIMSFMMFAMGLGSRLSKYMERYLLERFIIVEFILSILVGFCAVLAYGASAYASFNESLSIFRLPFDGVVIYTLSILVGLLIGMEIPLVARLNDSFESLKVNISNVMEKDYYGSLIGGLFFAFIGLPILGLVYTPFVLGMVNLLVALLLYFRLKELVSPHLRPVLFGSGMVVLLMLGVGTFLAKDIIDFGEQKRYKDKVVFQTQTPYQRIVLTQWKNDHWLYLNGRLQLSSFDEFLYHEPLVHPAMQLVPNAQEVLILGGGDGCAAREVLKYSSVQNITLVDLDPEMTKLAKTNPILTELNKNSLNNPKVNVINGDAYRYMEETQSFYDVIIIDFPDPKSIELARLYSQEMYFRCYQHLRPHGSLVVQSGSPYYATKAFYCIQKTLQSAGFENVVPMHNQVLTMGEWGWMLTSKKLSTDQIKDVLQKDKLEEIDTRWLTQDGMKQITSFGRNLVDIDSANLEVNKVHNPVLAEYYNKGNWDLY
ncbi:polyamine aminopropyltransferase [Sediminitomix flava]|uniref:Polyamine aminopropyltransferase n=1 Tax=Sediminitomix flava TaxID=379075 RepID=A0A315ZH76_SEDFL|nr:polyamine aminopropyltransferase [Sediminitomix flava]PWJ44533.1 spermidine synthase [Sediminitomix flava]